MKLVGIYMTLVGDVLSVAFFKQWF